MFVMGVAKSVSWSHSQDHHTFSPAPCPLHSTSSLGTPYLSPSMYLFHCSINLPPNNIQLLTFFYSRTKLIWLIFGCFSTKAKQGFLTSPLYVASGNDFEWTEIGRGIILSHTSYPNLQNHTAISMSSPTFFVSLSPQTIHAKRIAM